MNIRIYQMNVNMNMNIYEYQMSVNINMSTLLY